MPVPNQISFDIEVPQHAPDLYEFASVAEPLDGLGAVTDRHIAQYHEQGFLAVENALSPAEVRTAIEALSDLIAGRIPTFQNIQFRGDARDRLDAMTFEERLDSVRRMLYFTEHEPRLKATALKPQLLDVVSRLLGAEARLFQDMALIKPPAGREKPWHQDHAYFELSPATRVVGVWIALDAAGIENGCMRLMPGWHRRDRFPHFQIRDLQICDRDMNGLQAERVAAPLQPGGCLIFDSYLPHGTPANHTATRRRALQFHYFTDAAEPIAAAQRVALWGGEARGIAC
jgi:phytanoyl-CoA hydroxylase